MTKSNVKGIRLLHRIWEKSGGLCAHCGKKAQGNNRTIDHFIPKSVGGTYDQRNLIPLCKNCNHKRGSNQVNPKTYYPYISDTALQECMEYQKEFLQQHTNMCGITTN